MSTRDCTRITPQCPVEYTIYGYYPNLPGNVILCVVFGICMVLQVGLSIKGRTWTWLVGLFIGCAIEFAGYIGRIMMHSNPWNDIAFKQQIICLILAPSFVNGGIDLTLKHLVLRFGPQYSLIRPAMYTWVFIGLDAVSILIQAAGGGMAAAASIENVSLLNIGNNLILAGIALQVAQLVAFGIVSLHYAYNVYRHRKLGAFDGADAVVPGRLKYFVSMVAAAYFLILIRCIYRIPEMSGGWGSELQRDEPLFLVLDGITVAIACIALTVAHPALCFPEMGHGRKLIFTSEPESDVEK
ncbi:hypothetical protein MBM_08455 [Drepanopeziza brunnea f. sp. 'multigermtubi' MB_m1]|uniref:RTA1 domain protein n=1 Tax=Marssonina brunnea f. sp. multigermtubi (strain MB_m1) TaxID=1072389 RepID=K1WM12_MARBU|nr:uncharacterized protein MBM_08455 [Drepanopeziza brunnea f. sp. 'multigermtubi' MB_m1]EKD13372.1 hypothetical protein MBM_08455 [Drepanopeziza brunnea f. sp. 'multigermtubi' MB_m1]